MKELAIEKLVFGGMGLARTDSGIVFVEKALPGEIVQAELSGKKGGIPIYTVKEIITSSPARTTPSCQYFGICGGCDWQYIDYDNQVNLKTEIFKECIKRTGKIESMPEIEIYKSPAWKYRIRAQLKTDKKIPAMGFYKKQTREIIKINECPLLSYNLNKLLLNQEKILQGLPGGTKELKVFEGNDNIASFPLARPFTKKITKKTIGTAEFVVSGKDFFQGNKFLIEKMGIWSKESLKGDFFIDVFGGTGLFSVLHGNNFKNGILIETGKAQIKRAQINLKANNINNINAKLISAESFFTEIYKTLPQPDCIILDPPRPGISKIVRNAIINIAPPLILYISCNPSTQARDIGILARQAGYRIIKAAIFDLYPQTHHIETGLLLQRQ